MIHLETHNKQWKTLYNIEESGILQLIAKFSVHIEHIGSTSIPNIVAKPIIDIMIGVPDLLLADLFIVNKIQSLHYVYRPDLEGHIVPQRRFFQKYNLNGSRTHHIHMVALNSSFWVRHLQFRDYLLLYPDIAKKYEQLKTELSKKFSDTNLYAYAKSDFVKQIEHQATQYFNKKNYSY